MRVLWLCNIMLPMVAEELHMEASNKEGWLSGLASVMLDRQAENGIELAVAFPAPANLTQAMQNRTAAQDAVPWKHDPAPVYRGRVKTEKGGLQWYAFSEDVSNPHLYDAGLEQQMKNITCDFKPDVIHCFGTEYPHTLAMCRSFPEKRRILVGIQGLCAACADAYFANLPESVLASVTLRDILKRDSLRQQQHKFVLRGEMEYEAITLTGNVTGRTAWDKRYMEKWNKNARYFKINETLRKEFYTGQWSAEKCEPYSIFVSQGDYPLKGLHYMLLAMPAIRKAFPDVRVYVAGNEIMGEGSLAKRLKISSYGLYLRRLIQKLRLQGRICFLGRLDAEQMKQRYLKSNLFVCCSSLENSPNSLGEAMLLGVPCVSADVGGVASIFTHGKDGILFDGFKTSENSINNNCASTPQENALKNVADSLARAVIHVFSHPDKIREYSQNARNHAAQTHNRESNYRKMTEVYAEIARAEQVYENCEGQIRKESEPRFVFVSNYINHHQIPFCDAMYRQLEGAFTFIQTEPMEEERIRMGWSAGVKLPYIKYFYEEPELCRSLIAECSMVIFGGVDDESYIEQRLQSGKPVLRYSERLYKEGQWKAVSPRGLVKKYRDHTRYRNKPVYLLCAGAYVSSDFHIVRAYPHKMLKWGYFPETIHYDVDELMRAKKPATILWAARFLDWKHPEAALKCARYLKEKGMAFQMSIVGDGEQRPLVERLIKEYDLADCVTLLGYRAPEEVRCLMEQSDIYLTTSDRREGWGAVINEAMNSGCAVVASHMMGAAPWLIQNGVNGFLYRDGRIEQLCALTERLLRDRELCERLGRAAIATIEGEWNAQEAAGRLLRFCETDEMAGDGPCSPAEVVSERKMLWKIL